MQGLPRLVPHARTAEMCMCLQAYAGAYRGHAKLDRLLFIADKTKNPQLALEAYKLAHDEAKQVGASQCCVERP